MTITIYYLIFFIAFGLANYLYLWCKPQTEKTWWLFVYDFVTEILILGVVIGIYFWIDSDPLPDVQFWKPYTFMLYSGMLTTFSLAASAFVRSFLFR